MEYEDQERSSLFLLNLKRHEEKLIENNIATQACLTYHNVLYVSLLLVLQVNQRLHKWGPNQGIANRLQ